MIDRVSGLWTAGGKAGLGRIRVEKDVVPDDWFFKAHFFQDPVQPGSLGLEMMLQALEVLLLEGGQSAGLAHPEFEAPATGVPLTWKYRGQVVPEHATITVDAEITALPPDPRGVLALAEGSLWVDGRRIYHAAFSTRIVSGHPSGPECTAEGDATEPTRPSWAKE